MLAFLLLTAVTFSLFGFIIASGRTASSSCSSCRCCHHSVDLLGGTFYSISVLPPAWQTVTLFNPVVYLVSGFRWSFYEIADVNVGVSLAMTGLFLAACLPRYGGSSRRLPAED